MGFGIGGVGGVGAVFLLDDEDALLVVMLPAGLVLLVVPAVALFWAAIVDEATLPFLLISENDSVMK